MIPALPQLQAPSLVTTPSPRDPRLDEQSMFAGVLARAKDAGTPQARAREAAEQLVATALVLPALKGLRERANAAPPFAPGPAERTFGQLQDTTLAQRLVKASNWPLVDRLAQRVLERSRAFVTDVPR